MPDSQESTQAGPPKMGRQPTLPAGEGASTEGVGDSTTGPVRGPDRRASQELFSEGKSSGSEAPKLSVPRRNTLNDSETRKEEAELERKIEQMELQTAEMKKIVSREIINLKNQMRRLKNERARQMNIQDEKLSVEIADLTRQLERLGALETPVAMGEPMSDDEDERKSRRRKKKKRKKKKPPVGERVEGGCSGATQGLVMAMCSVM